MITSFCHWWLNDWLQVHYGLMAALSNRHEEQAAKIAALKQQISDMQETHAFAVEVMRGAQVTVTR
jgi:hypothetical protein